VYVQCRPIYVYRIRHVHSDEITLIFYLIRRPVAIRRCRQQQQQRSPIELYRYIEHSEIFFCCSSEVSKWSMNTRSRHGCHAWSMHTQSMLCEAWWYPSFTRSRTRACERSGNRSGGGGENRMSGSGAVSGLKMAAPKPIELTAVISRILLSNRISFPVSRFQYLN